MKVTLTTEFVTDIGGAQRDLANISNLYPESKIHVLLAKKHKNSLIDFSRVHQPSLSKVCPEFLKSKHKIFLPFLPYLASQVKVQKADVFLSVSHSFAKWIKKPEGSIHISYCFSPTRYLWDWTHNYLDEIHSGVFSRLILKKIFYELRQKDFEAAQKVDHFIAISKTVQKRIEKYYRRPSKVIYPGVDLDKYKISKENKGYFLLVGQLTPYKNFKLAVKAFKKLNWPLLIVGEGSQKKELEKIAGKKTRFLGRVKDRDLVKIYKNSLAVMVPGQEDFGLVAVEAMACGKPVLAFEQGGSTEIIKQEINGEFFKDDQSVEDLIMGVKKIRKNYQDYDQEVVRRSVEKFGLERFGREMKSFVKEKA